MDFDLYVSNLEVLQVFNVGRVVTISVASLEHPESAASHRVHIGPSIRQQLQSEDLQNAAIVCKPEAQGIQSQSVLSCDSSHHLNQILCSHDQPVHSSLFTETPADQKGEPHLSQLRKTLSSIVLNLCHIMAVATACANIHTHYVQLFRSPTRGEVRGTILNNTQRPIWGVEMWKRWLRIVVSQLEGLRFEYHRGLIHGIVEKMQQID